MGNRRFQSCGNEAETAFPLCQTEPAFNLHTLSFVDVILLFISNLIFLRSAQSRSRKPYMMKLAVSKIVTVSVYLIRQYPTRVLPGAFSVPFYHICLFSNLYTHHHSKCRLFRPFSRFSLHLLYHIQGDLSCVFNPDLDKIFPSRSTMAVTKPVALLKPSSKIFDLSKSK